jgi:7-carboxy-7-deazaguanine synthase
MTKDEEIRLNEGRILPLVEEFYTVQGEGFHTGKAAYFIRIGGCDIGCAWCDSKFSWNQAIHPLVEVETIVENVLKNHATSVVVTGGEPMNYNLDYLCKKLKDNQIETFLETSGSSTLSGNWNWICLSPKKQAPPLPENMKFAGELKVIIQTSDDFRWAEENALLVNPECMLFLQPEWSCYHKIISEIVEYVKNHPQWMISLQAHKFMKIP